MADFRPRDLELLDALDTFERVPLQADAWRTVHAGRDPLIGYPSRARWDQGGVDVIYTSLERETSLAEVYFHLQQQPVFPSKLKSVLHRLSVSAHQCIDLTGDGTLEALGVDQILFESFDYRRTQATGDAAAFLGFDSILAPSARAPGGRNLIVFTERVAPDDVELSASEDVDWTVYRRRRGA